MAKKDNGEHIGKKQSDGERVTPKKEDNIKEVSEGDKKINGSETPLKANDKEESLPEGMRSENLPDLPDYKHTMGTLEQSTYERVTNPNYNLEKLKEEKKLSNVQKKAVKEFLLKRDSGDTNPLISGTKVLDLDSMAKDLKSQVEKAKKEAVDIATEELVNEFLSTHHIKTIRDDKSREMWVYHNGIYVQNGESWVKTFVRERTGMSYKKHFYNRVIDKIEADTFIEADDFFKEPPLNLIPCKNGILNLETGELEPYDPKYHFFNKLQIDYVPSAKINKIKTFFDEVMTKQDVVIMQEVFGSCLYREYRWEKSFMLFGDGENGKSKTLALMKLLLGDENVKGVSLMKLISDQYAVSELHKALANIAGDVGSKPLDDTDTFKTITGRDLITANRKHKTQITFVNYATLIFSCNELPRAEDTTDGFFRRWIQIDFPYKFLSKEEIDQLKPEDRKNKKEKVDNIVEQITTEEELQGLLVWAVEGLKRLLENGGYSHSETTEQTRIKWTRKSDSFMAFCDDHIRESWGNGINKDELRKVYSHYCRDNKLKHLDDKHIKKILSEKLGAGTKRETGGEREMVWDGIVWKHPEYIKDIISGDGNGNGNGDDEQKGEKEESKPEEIKITHETVSPKNNSVKPITQKVVYSVIKDHPEITHIFLFNEVKNRTGRRSNPGISDNEDINKILEDLKEKGDIFEPKPGRYRCV